MRTASVQKSTGFRVYFGPVDARYLPRYIENIYTAQTKMRMVRFNMFDRLVLTPMEMVPALKKFPGIALMFTGSTALTGISGVQKEIKVAIPVNIVSVGIALVLIVLYKLITPEIV